MRFHLLVITASLALTASSPPTTFAQEQLSGNYFAHDPSTIIKDGNRYYFFRTDRGISINWSTDLRNWTGGGRVFPGGPPAWATNAISGYDPNNWAWAPDVAYFNGKYHVYYSVSEWGTIDSAIGLVTSPSLVFPVWTDQGKVIQSDASWEAGPDTDLTANNCIDPAILQDTNGTIWMVFGSYSDGILVMQLNPSTGKRLNPAAAPVKIADNGTGFFSNTTEAAYLYQRGGYYYLFLNFGGCCQGVNSTYNIRVGRSTSITGPFLDRNGVNMLDGGGTLLLGTSGRYIGPGHAGIVGVNGTDWLSYHYYDGQDNGAAKLGLRQLLWTPDGWPDAIGNATAFSAFYTFDVDARDHLGLHNGQLIGQATVTPEPERGKVLQLDGASGYVQLPGSLANGRTFAAWAKWNGGGTWQRIFDFGDGATGGTTGRYMFLSPRANSGTLRFAITVAGNQNEQIIDAPSALPTNSWTHVAVTIEPGRGVLYVNGEPVGTNSSMSLSPSGLSALNNYLGRSQWPDPLFNGRIDSFRAIARVLSADEIRDLAHAHPSLAHRFSFVEDASDAFGLAHGSVFGSALVNNGALVLNGESGGYVGLPGGVVSGCAAVSVEFWAEFRENGNGARVFDFGRTSGSTGTDNLFYSPHTSLGGQSLVMAGSGGFPINLATAGTLDNRAVHVVCVIAPSDQYGAIYTNGVLQREWNAPLPALSGVSSSLSYIGRSLSSGDAWLNATIDELRIYDGRLTSEEIVANFRAGPDFLALPIILTWSDSAPGLLFNWPDYAVGYELESSPTAPSGGSWSTFGGLPTLVNGRYQMPVPMNASNQLFRLSR